VAWWEKAANALGRGILFTIDYGLTSAEQLLPQHAHGTLRTFFSHRVGGDPLESPGQCDITAHVSFSAIEAAGVSAGLTTGGLTEQAKFLTRILAQIEEKPGKFDAWTPARTRQFQTLTHPDHLGRAFRVLIQARHPVRPH
jgi:SAM-dependent MidA family methyltransferase